MPLSEREVHLWSVPLHEAEPPASLLAADERARAERFRCPRARAAFIQTRAALRLLLGHYLDMAPLAVALSSGAQGKPRLGAGMGALHFNVSHSGRLALIALSQAAVGVDLEEQPADFGWRELLPVCCHHAERSAFQEVTDAVGRARLLGLWTAKEAYLKGRGEGLSLPLTAIRLQACRGGWQPVIETPWDDGRGWRLRALSLPEGYVGCLATPSPSPLIRFQPLADLTRNGRAEDPVTPMSCYP
ncbi:MAG: 4'-phosphopantetheinyl transferase superfamily protein [Pseudomonadota bacterium]